MNLTTKQQIILNTAIPLFMKKGYNETSMHDIAELMEIKASSLYAHIKSKNDILVWICNDVQDRLKQIMVEVDHSEKEPVEKFQFFVLRHVEEILKYKYQHDIFLRNWKLVDPKNRNRYKKQYESYQDFVEKLIEMAIPHNTNVSCFQKNTIVYVMLLILNHIPRWVKKGEAIPKEISEVVLKKFLYGFEKA